MPNLDYDVIVHSERTWEFERMAGAPENRAPEYGDIWSLSELNRTSSGRQVIVDGLHR